MVDYRQNSKKVTPKKYIVVRVDGDWMSVRGVYLRNIIFIQHINAD